MKTAEYPAVFRPFHNAAARGDNGIFFIFRNLAQSSGFRVPEIGFAFERKNLTDWKILLFFDIFVSIEKSHSLRPGQSPANRRLSASRKTDEEIIAVFRRVFVFPKKFALNPPAL